MSWFLGCCLLGLTLGIALPVAFLKKARRLALLGLLGVLPLLGKLAFPEDVWSRARPAVRSFGLQDGLPNTTVYQVLEDRAGRLWAATQAGTAFYDGLTWRTFAPPRDSGVSIVRSILEGRDGSRWLGTEHAGLWRFKDGAWTSFRAGSGLPVDRVNHLLETTDATGKDTLWVCTAGGGLARLRDGEWKTYDEKEGLPELWLWKITALRMPNGSQELVVSSPKGCARLRGERWEAWDPVPGQGEGETGSLLWGKEGDAWCLWVAAWGRGLLRWDGQKGTTFNPSNGFPSYFPTTIVSTQDSAGQTVIWVGTYDKGLFRYQEGRWHPVSLGKDMPSSGVYNLLAPRQGKPTLWIGMRDGGVGRLDLGSWRTLDRESGLPSEEVTCFAQTRDETGAHRTWVGSAKALSCWEGGGWRHFSTRNGLPSERVNTLLAVAGRGGAQALWVGTQKGLARWDQGVWSSVSLADSGLKDEQVYALAETRAPDGSPILWVGTEAGLLRIQGREKRVFTLQDGLPSLFIYHLLETRDADGGSSLWAATRGGGVARYKGGVWTGQGMHQGQPNLSIYHLKETHSKDGRRWLWAASFGNGILRRSLDREDAPWEVFDDQNLPQLPSNGILRMEEDKQGFLYAMTQRGVVRLRFEDPLDPVRPTGLETHSTESGLPSPMCSFGASLRDARGRIWVGTPHGAAVLDPVLETEVPPPTSLVLERLTVSGRARQPLPSPAFTHRENSLTFEFAMPHLAKDGDAYFRTRMLGLESDPTDWTQATQREFTALASGPYTFRVWGRDQLGREAPPLDFPFTIRPAPWKHPLALAGYLALVVVATLGAVQARHRALERRNEELEAKVKERTLQLEERSRELAASERRAQEASQAKSVFLSNMSHELRTPLNAILGFARLMRRAVGIRNQDRDHLDRIHRAGEHLLGLINDVLSISKIEAGKLVLNPVPFALRPFAQGIEEMMQVRTNEKGLTFQVEIDPNLPEACLADEGKLRQVLINLLGNAIKFTATGTVGLSFLAQEESVHFSVWDTGPGIGPHELETLFQEFTQTETGRQSREGTGLGLHISQAMVKLMGGELRVDSQLGRGTTFFFTLNLETAQGQVRQVAKPRQILGLAEGEAPRKILVVDDQVDNRDLARELLEAWGFEVQVAEDGVSGLEVWERWQPEAVFMDLRMPRMRGEAAATKLRELEGNRTWWSGSARSPRGEHEGDAERPKEAGGPPRSNLGRTAIFALSASVLGIDRDQIITAGFDEFIQKPFHEHILAEVLERYLGVRFRTEGLGAAPPEPPTSIDWQAFPEAWRQAFRQALLLGDLDEAQARLQELGEHPALAYLELRVREFRTEEILQQMGE